MGAVVDMGQARELVRARSCFSKEETDRIVAVRFDHVPRRVVAGLAHWPLDRAAVLDVGCGYGTCLIHFGPGSVGIDNGPEECAFVRSLGLDVRRLDVDTDEVPEEWSPFDYVWVSDLLEHLEAPRRFLRRLHPLVGGSLLLQVSVLPGLTKGLLRRLGEKPFDADVHYHQWTSNTIQHLVRRAGFRPVKIVPVLPARLQRAPFPIRWASRLIVEARPDEGLRRLADRSEARNTHRIP
jgi:SAM-dependent methyltransferase